MSNFENYLLSGEQIPFKVAADFFLSVRAPFGAQEKTAGLEDAPDEMGELEGTFEVPVENAVALMGNALKVALYLIQASLVYSNSARGPLSTCMPGDWSYREVAEYLTKRMAVLTGPVHVADVPSPPPSTNATEILRRFIRGEQELIAALKEVRLVVGENPMRFTLERFMADIQQRMDDHWRKLEPTTPLGQPAPPIELAEHESTETPADEAAESPEFQAAEQAAGTEEHEVPSAKGEKTASIDIAKLAQLMKTALTGGQAALMTGGLGALGGAALQGKTRKSEVGGALGGGIGGGLGAATGTILGAGMTGGLRGALAGAAAGGLVGSSVLGRIAGGRHKTAFDLSQGATGESQMSSPSPGGELEPMNYLQAEQAARQAQEENEANYYRQQSQQSQQQIGDMSQQVAEMQAQVAELQAQTNAAGAQIQSAQAQAMAAYDDSLRQSQIAANMRMGMQKMRAAMMEIVSQDPAAMAAGEMQAGAAGGMAPDAGLGDPAAQEGAPAGENAPVQPGATPLGGDPSSGGEVRSGGMPGVDMSTATPATDVKMASPLLAAVKAQAPWALLGGAVGATQGALQGKKAPEHRAKVKELEAGEGFLNAMRLAAAKAQLAQSEFSESHPAAAATLHGGSGALAGAAFGPAIQASMKNIFTP